MWFLVEHGQEVWEADHEHVQHVLVELVPRRLSATRQFFGLEFHGILYEACQNVDRVQTIRYDLEGSCFSEV